MSNYPSNWEILDFKDIISKEKIKLPKSILKRNYRSNGKYPIVDQSSSLIAGYTKEENRIFYLEKPLIIFGDHTRIFKYIDFNFALGADGTKVINTSEKMFPKFLYYFYLYIQIPSKGYNRHYKLLKEIEYPRPPLPEQKKIAYVLSTIQEAKEKTEKVIEAAQELKKSLMKYLFTYGPVPVQEAENVPLKETEIGRIPEDWDEDKFENISRIVRGGSPRPKGDPKYFTKTNTGIHWIMISDLTAFKKGKYITNTKEFLTEEGKKKSRYLESGSFVITNSGTVGIPAFLDINGCIHDGYLAILDIKPVINRDYLYYLISFYRKYLIDIAPKGTQANLNTKIAKQLNIYYPEYEKQTIISNILNYIDEKIDNEISKKQALETLFKSMLEQLMTGALRVNDLEVETCSTQA